MTFVVEGKFSKLYEVADHLDLWVALSHLVNQLHHLEGSPHPRGFELAQSLANVVATACQQEQGNFLIHARLPWPKLKDSHKVLVDLNR